MPTARARGVQEDARAEPAATRDRQTNTGASKSRRQAPASAPTGTAAKNTTATATTNANTANNVDSTPGINWSSENISTLNAYRIANRLDTASAFRSPTAAAVLTSPGIAKYSPTMVRRKDRNKVSKEHLATAVRKHFNAVAVTETDVMVNFMNKAKNQDKTFRTRSAPNKQKS